MNESLERLFRRLLDELDLPESSEWDETESLLDASVYSDPAFLEAEIERIFRRVPLCLGHADQLREPGSMIAREILGYPLLITRDRAGEINVLLNVCRHRGARLIATDGEVCNANSISCPYHAWTYDLAGTLRAIPGNEGFPTVDRSERGLRRLPSEVRHGLIWVGLDPTQSELDVADYLGDIDNDLTALDLESHRFYRQHARVRKANWKLLMDAFQEVYHIRRLHARTISPFFLERKSAGESVGRHLRILVGRDRLREAVDLPSPEWSPRRHATLTHAVFPNSLIIYHPDSTSHLAMFPTAPDEILFVHTMFLAHDPQTDKERAHWERNFAMIDEGVFGDEDLFISEQIQKGVNSGANSTFVLGRFEQHLRRFHENVRAMISEPVSGAGHDHDHTTGATRPPRSPLKVLQ